jgi:hypothetical protein
MRLPLSFLVLASLVLAACSKLITPTATPTTYVPKQIWSGQSGGYQVSWTTADITASPTGATRESFSELGRTISDFHGITRSQSSDCDMTRQADLQSVVGPYLSIRTLDTMKCTNGAEGSGRGALAFDLAHPVKPVSLASLFPARELSSLRVKAEHFCATVPGDLLDRFAFSELHGHVVIVAVTLPPACSTTEVDLALNVPATAGLATALGLAAKRSQGFLWHDQPAVSGGTSTTINYHYRAAVQ